VLSGLMADFFEGAIKKLQEKIWDCDLEATKAYYRKKIEEAEKALSAEKPAARSSYGLELSLLLLLDGLRLYEPHSDYYAALSLAARAQHGLRRLHAERLLLLGLLQPRGRDGRRLLLGLPQRLPRRLPFGLPLGLSFRLPLGLSLRLRVQGGGALRRAPAAEEAESFYRGIRPWLLVRGEDAVLIVPPNRVYKLGGSALGLLSWLDGGGRLRDLPGLDEARAARAPGLFRGAARRLRGPLARRNVVPTGRRGFGRVGYDFDFTRLPILGEAALTYRCNERCRFCYAACGEASWGSLPLADASLERRGERAPHRGMEADHPRLQERGQDTLLLLHGRRAALEARPRGARRLRAGPSGLAST
jgi:hypothetical protein